MRRSLGVLQLSLLGVGGIIGTGIFVLSGQVAAHHAGPAVLLSFAMAGGAALLAALCYSERGQAKRPMSLDHAFRLPGRPLRC